MNPSEMTIALKEISEGQIWSMSSIEPKTEAKKQDWDRMKEEYVEQQNHYG